MYVNIIKSRNIVPLRWNLIKCVTVVVIILAVLMFSFNSAFADIKRETIGVVGFLSGGALLWGLSQQQAVGLWVGEVNEKGGLLVGGNKVIFDIASYDDFSNTSGGVDAIQKLIFRDNVKIAFGPILSSGTIAVKDIVNENKILQLSPCTSPIVSTPEYPYQFVFYQAGYEKAYTISKYLDDHHPKVSKIVFIVPSDETKSEIELVQKMVSKGDREIVSVELYERGTTDFYPLLQRVLSKNPDCILLDSNPPADCFNITKQARELGFDGLMGATAGGLDMEAFYKVAGEAGEGFFCTTLPSGEFSPPQYDDFVNKFRKTFGRYDTWCGTIYVMCQVLEQAILSADSTDPSKIIEVLESGKEFDTVIGKVSFGGKEFYGRNSHMIFNVGVGVLREGKEVCEYSIKTDYSN